MTKGKICKADLLEDWLNIALEIQFKKYFKTPTEKDILYFLFVFCRIYFLYMRKIEPCIASNLRL